MRRKPPTWEVPILFVWITLLVWGGISTCIFPRRDEVDEQSLSEAGLYLGKRFIQKTLKNFSLRRVLISVTNVLHGFFSPAEKNVVYLNSFLEIRCLYLRSTQRRVHKM